ncbi:MAG TPA: helix-turn-helix domain-containing protein [Gemmataceae bacterium]|jgi:HTH-type transcriptional regulator/antitoxin HigA|nr:helix-turn-helix domain-containing protein [Gemmataceae bacterium]
MSKTYYSFVKQFPLIHITDSKRLESAQAFIDHLLQQELDQGGQEYFDALTDLVEIYEDEHESIADASEADVLRELIRSSGLSQNKLAQKVGISQSTISAVLNEERSLTKNQVIKLADFFKVSPAAFLAG